jgi:hypothetical protein
VNALFANSEILPSKEEGVEKVLHYPGGQDVQPPRQLAFFAPNVQLRGCVARHKLPLQVEAALPETGRSQKLSSRSNDPGKECVLMKILTPLFITAVLLVPQSPIPMAANNKRPSLPAIVRNAKMVYVENHTTSAELQNTAYTELAKWGRFQIVDNPQKADIVLQLSNGNYVKFVSGGENPAAAGAKAGKQDWVGADGGVPPGSTRISVIEPKSGNSLWSDVRKTDNAKAATHMLDGLREAFDQAEKGH